jgi:hypothetical protein
VIHLHAAVLQQELEIADREHQIPSDRPQDHLSGELPTFESLILPYLCCSSPSRHGTASTRLDRQQKDATEPDDLPLKAPQQPLRLGQGQTQVGDIGEITGPVGLYIIFGWPVPRLQDRSSPPSQSSLRVHSRSKIQS